MDRRSLIVRWSAAALLLALLAVGSAGCSVLQSAVILYQGTDLAADFDGLKGKKVVVVCKPLTALDFTNPGVDRALAEGISERLKIHIKDIHIIDAEKVAKLRDEKGMNDYLEIGRALKADMVVGVDIESFGVLDGQTLFKGRSKVTIRVYDVAEKSVEWRKSPPQVEYPKFSSMPMSDSTEVEFRDKFVTIIAEQVARHFYPHDPRDDVGEDALSVH